MSGAGLVLTGALLSVTSGLVALFFRRTVLSTVLHLTGSLVGLAGCAMTLAGGEASAISLPWSIPFGAALIRVDTLSAFFAAPAFFVAGAGALYAERTWPIRSPRGAQVRCFFGVLSGSLALVMTAGNTIFFVAMWEMVALASFFLIGIDADDAEARGAAWLFLAASHIATLGLFAGVSLLHSLTGNWTFSALPPGAGATAPAAALFWIALAAFGIKAGMMPFHVWLPGAHASAPPHVSALLSGVVLKMGIYGLVRILSLYGAVPAWMGGTILILGIVSSILGVAFALAQHDLKRLLAYHSIENIGIILIGLGTGLVARAHGAPVIAALGFGGALLHVWNHALFKSLLFLAAGAAVHGAHTREMDRMGGLLRLMPGVAAGFAVGAVAICGLPPLNGFVSEWLLYMASFTATGSSHGGWSWLLLLVAPALALTGALALACFVKAFGAVFLGTPRTAEAAQAVNPPISARAALVPLASACLIIGIAPLTVVPLLSRIVKDSWGIRGGPFESFLTPIQWSAIGLATALIIAGLALFGRVRGARREVTWDCGYAAPTPRMQYTSSSTARTLVGFFSWAMRPVVHESWPRTPIAGGDEPRSAAHRNAGPPPLFPVAARLSTHVPDTVLDRLVAPIAGGIERLARLARPLQSGRMQQYLLYIGATLIALLVWSFR